MAPGVRSVCSYVFTDREVILSSSRLRDAAAELGVEVGFLPHPNLHDALRDVTLPEHIRRFTFDDDVQELFARAAVLVTDYSSMAFNSACIDRAVVYYQFDRDRVSSGRSRRPRRCCERVTDAVLASARKRPVVPAP